MTHVLTTRFFYGINSTKIFCKSSCSAKLSKRELDSFQTAESKGFRARLRCQPKLEMRLIPKAVRAVARTCATNRIELVIPCHRVVATNGNLSGYRWGIERKEKLLIKEKQ